MLVNTRGDTRAFLCSLGLHSFAGGLGDLAGVPLFSVLVPDGGGGPGSGESGRDPLGLGASVDSVGSPGLPREYIFRRRG